MLFFAIRRAKQRSFSWAGLFSTVCVSPQDRSAATVQLCIKACWHSNTQCQQHLGALKGNFPKTTAVGCVPESRVVSRSLSPCVHTLHKRPTSGLELINLQPQFVDLIRQPPLFGAEQMGRGVGFALMSSQVWGKPHP